MHLFYQPAFMEALGWALVDSFWKMGGLWIAYLLITGNGKRFSAAARYFLAVAFISGGTVWAFLNIPFYYHEIRLGNEVSSLGIYFRNGFVFVEQFFPWFSSFYVLSVLFLSGRLFYQYYSGRKNIYTNITAADASVTHIVDRLAAKIHLGKKIRVYLSDHITTPLTIGFIRPVILLPVALFNHLSIEQAESIIAHELFHIRRNDYLVNIMVSLSGVLLFFNPFAKLFEQVIRKERENVCDDKVIANGFDKWQYAHALYIIGKNNSLQNPFVMPASGNKLLLLERIGRILKRTVKKRRPMTMDLIKPLALFIICTGACLFLGRDQKLPAANVKINLAEPATRYTMVLVPDKAGPSSPSLPVEITFHEKTVAVVKRDGKKSIEKRVRPTAEDTSAAIASVAPEASKTAALPGTGELYKNYFVSVNTTGSGEFTLQLPAAPTAFEVVDGLDSATPYVPSSTFYYSVIADKNPTTGTIRKTVHL